MGNPTRDAARLASDLTADAVQIARRAGERILELYARETTVSYKVDHSPLTAADRAAHESICRDLQRLAPQLPIVSEESTPGEIRSRSAWESFWLVDPLDGTKEFLKRTGEFTVNLALVHLGRPILGVVHVPAMQRTYFATVSHGAFREASGVCERIRVRPCTRQRLTIVASRDHAGPAVRSLLERLPGARTASLGSSLKFCLVAEGKADLYARDVPTMEWDTAAAQCVLEQAGGSVITWHGHPLTYNKADLRNPAIAALGDPRVLEAIPPLSRLAVQPAV